LNQDIRHYTLPKLKNEELYKNRFKIEQANDWLDGYKSLIMRYRVYLQVPQKSLNTFFIKKN